MRDVLRHHRSAEIGSRRGSAATIAMLYLVILSTLGLAMFHMSALNAQTAVSLADVEQARTIAESGLRWQAYRLSLAANRPVTSAGNITSDVAAELWPQVRDRVATDWQNLPGGAAGAVTLGDTFVEMEGLETDGGLFQLRLERLPTYDTNPNSPTYRHFVRLISTGIVRPGSEDEVRRTVRLDFSLDKRINYAVVGKTRIQLGRNTIIEGPVAMTTRNKFSPYLVLSDFKHFDSTLRNRVELWEQFLIDEHDGYDNRIWQMNDPEWEAALDAGFVDYNEDGYMDEFDLFLERFDSDGDKAVDRLEFTDVGTGELYDRDLWAAIDSVGAPMFEGDVVRNGYLDDRIDSSDLYAKIRGQVTLKDDATAWSNWLDSNRMGPIQDQLQGPIVPQEGEVPVQFNASSDEMIDLNPAHFEEAAEIFRSKTGEAAGSAARTQRQATASDGSLLVDRRGKPVMETATVENAQLSVSDASYLVDSRGDPVTATVNERTPYGSTSYQATYSRPVFKDMHLKNVIIPKGMNALFDNCTFEGVTFVDMTRDIVTGGSVRYDSGSGSTWSKRMRSGSFSASTVLTASNSYGFTDGNNIRFNNCTFFGPLVNPYATAYTHFTNSWEFTGATVFDNQADQSATIIAPQTNIEMGSFTNPGAAPSTLVGVVVAGNIDIRGTSVVDGSIIVTGDGAGNTTLAYFGASDSDTDPGALPDGGYGRLNIRYNPYRALPDGITIAVLLEPVAATYVEE